MTISDVALLAIGSGLIGMAIGLKIAVWLHDLMIPGRLDDEQKM